MNKIYTIVILVLVLFIAGCVSGPVLKTEDENTKEDNFCVDNNNNGICDDKEVPAKVEQAEPEPVEPEPEPLPEQFVDVLANSDKIESYNYVKKTYEDGLESTSIDQRYELWYKDGKMKQEFGGDEYYFNDGTAYIYSFPDNESTIISKSLLKEDTLLGELDDVDDVDIEKEQFIHGSYNTMIITYTKDGDYYRTMIWKYYGIPLRIEINNQDGDGTVIRYESDINTVSDEEVELPDSEIVG